MKFLKSTIAIVALLAIGSVNAKVMKKTQSTVQPTVQLVDIQLYVNEVFKDNDDELTDMLLMNYDDYDQQEICTFIKQLAQFVADKFPMNIPAAKKSFKEQMTAFCNSIKNNNTRIMFIQQCIDNSMNMPGATNTPSKKTTGTRNMRRDARYNGRTINK
jgi:hypothetical protein